MDSTWLWVIAAVVVIYGIYNLIKKSIVIGIVLVVVGLLVWPVLKPLLD